jgi:hypothetical protein
MKIDWPLSDITQSFLQFEKYCTVLLDKTGKILEYNQLFSKLLHQSAPIINIDIRNFLLGIEKTIMQYPNEKTITPIECQISSNTHLRYFKGQLIADSEQWLIIGRESLPNQDKIFEEMSKITSELTNVNRELERRNQKVLEAQEKIKVLQGLLPTCSFCKKIRDDQDNWVQMERYIHDRSEASFSHGLCPSCAKEHYGDLSES